jgi:predicted ester cyclase
MDRTGDGCLDSPRAARFEGMRIQGTHTKRVMGVETTGHEVTISGLSAAVIQNGKVVEHWEFSDDLSVMAQLQAAAQHT